MVKCANKHRISFETVNPSPELLKQMPLWHHPGEDEGKRQENNSKKAVCMRAKHAASTMGDALEMVRRLDNPLHAGRATCMCECDDCDVDRTENGCEDPHACATKAKSSMGQICPKWIP
ncbi:hypothetical protein B0H10DRAFT_1717603, partial [Mycena sp. CBHHK59/15]